MSYYDRRATDHKASIMMGAAVVLDMEALQKAAEGWGWEELPEPNWKVMRGEHVILRGDVPVEILQAIGAQIEVYREILQASIGGEPGLDLFKIRIFSNQADFIRFYGPLESFHPGAFYVHRSMEIVLQIDGPEAEEELITRVVAHEFTHAYMHRVFGVLNPTWFSEGMAEYFTNVRIGPGGVLVPGGLNATGLGILRENQWRLPTIQKLTAMSQREFYSHGYASNYAQAWLFTLFLFDFKLKAIKRLLGAKDVGFDLVKVEKDWRAYLDLALRQA
jgi:hypothetical protein